jgi:ABC-type antimicrobial peptide transport system permease subunit
VVYGNRNWVPVFIYGTTPDFLTIREWGLARGEMFTGRDVRNASKVCVLGQRLVRELFQGEDPMGKEVRVKNVAFKVVGILSAKGANMMGMDQDDILLAPWTAIKFRVTGSSAETANQSASTTSSTSSTSDTVNTLNELYPSTKTSLYPEQSAIQAADTPQPVRFINVDHILSAGRSTREVPAAIKEITQVLRERHRIRPGQPEDFNIRDMTEMTKTLSSTTTLMTRLLLAVALISLLVGGVGIMNIMLVSVTERTREIGIRLAIGALEREVLLQFLVEAVVLSSVGGIIGILLAVAVSFGLASLMHTPLVLSPGIMLLAFLFSAAVGVIFGFFPARKAARQDPIEALRYE